MKYKCCHDIQHRMFLPTNAKWKLLMILSTSLFLCERATFVFNESCVFFLPNIKKEIRVFFFVSFFFWLSMTLPRMFYYFIMRCRFFFILSIKRPYFISTHPMRIDHIRFYVHAAREQLARKLLLMEEDEKQKKPLRQTVQKDEKMTNKLFVLVAMFALCTVTCSY